GHPVDAINLVQQVVTGLDWPQPYLDSLIGDTLFWQDRLAEAKAHFLTAAEGFDQLGYTLEANQARVAAAEVLLQAGDLDEAEGLFTTALAHAGRSINPMHQGLAQAGLGKVYEALGRFGEAQDSFRQALKILNGLGWWRLEAEIALHTLQVSHRQTPHWQRDFDRVRGYVQRLPSTDLQAQLDELR
ncbi:MAG: tetratricopeptide repeat protein, partial [Chloroflexi bacterium]|nr:tetratricopeptide repeat protein [Chloroflexota bacterium]